ncbi:MAG: c-type cytochrome [Candidatus Competibacter sp.]|nr:cytochrome c family protein [Candidatus Competibacter sp.]MCC9001714.1 cytochrome c family protein [Candidatus Competibacter sp.]
MHKHLIQLILAIGGGLLILVALIWVIDPTVGLFTLMTPASTEEELRYAVKPVGLDGPAGQCVVCHSVEKGGPMRVAPNLWSIVGAPKAREKGYGYSTALASAGGVWTQQDLNDYLAAPDKFLPGTKKTIIGLPKPKERAELITFLATLKD